ncbi:uncharacterized protein N7484_011275 [Penicillium longicatenatum]|uniref:uncharacterized protein n=1 Tax=Penicillium longicatenatum TaxID=1561947 RepID=UPI0025482E8E|nr:uncharacterized protein N7484_011275 [Penicillium longicatenatum]KAJ5631175.1 hypothetical protein N7484_011275 [Penicillium longicatenatum]
METASSMAPATNHRESWDSLSSTFAHLEVSFSHDSCYGSDEVSVSSKTTAPLQSSGSTFKAKRDEPSLHPFLKSILKNSTTNVQEDESDSESESGYESDDIEFDDYDALSEEDDEDDMSDFSVWDDETEHNVPETHRDHTDSFDDSFIGFETSVRFDPQVQYIDTPTTELSEDDGCHSEMTVHEMMLLAQKGGCSQVSSNQADADDSLYDDNECDHKEFFRMKTTQLEDFTRDAVDVDQRLFIAYMHGIHGIADTNYKTYLRAQADNIRLGHETESMHPDDPPCMYLDLILDHVIGVFRNLLAEDELNGLIALRREDLAIEPASGAAPGRNPHQVLLDKIEKFLLNRLTNGHVDVLPDELSFFAGGIAHALGTEDLPPFV